MTRAARAENSAAEQTSSQRVQIKSAAQRQAEATKATEQAIQRLAETISQADQSMSRAESNQAELMGLVERAARDLTDLIEESQQAAQKYQSETTGAAMDLRRASDEAISAATGIEQSIEAMSRKSAGRIVQATKRLDQTARRLRWTVMLLMLATGAVIGAALLLAFQFWQPDVTAAIWRLATGR